MAYKEESGEKYGKKNWLKWVLIYLVIGGVIYFVVYYLFLRHTGTPTPTTGTNNPFNY